MWSYLSILPTGCHIDEISILHNCFLSVLQTVLIAIELYGVLLEERERDLEEEDEWIVGVTKTTMFLIQKCPLEPWHACRDLIVALLWVWIWYDPVYMVINLLRCHTMLQKMITYFKKKRFRKYISQPFLL